MDIKKILASIVIIVIILMIGYSNKSNIHLVDSNKYSEEISKEHNEHREEFIEEPEDEIKLKLEEMTLDEKIGQLVLVGMDGYELNDNITTLIESYNVGGVILYGKNIKDSSQLISLINSLKKNNLSNKAPLFVSVDEEGGSVSRLPKEIKKLPTSRSIGETLDTNIAFETGRLIGQALNSFGYNMNYAPVLDIDSNPLNPVIGNRSYGQTADIVSSMGMAALKGIKSEGIIPVIKHFPGHGDTSVDSHIGLPVVNHDIKRLNSFEIIPFKNAIDNGADVVMVAHILLPQIDNKYPASMSDIIIADILRKDLGFGGVVITDDITMGAIEKNYNIGDAAVRSIVAGTDIILVGHNYNMQIEVLNSLKNAANSGIISMDRIDESVYRILNLKAKYELNNDIIDNMDLKDINQNISEILSKIKNYR